MSKDSTLQRTFVTGLLIVIPAAVTVAILGFLFNLLDDWLTPALLGLFRLFRIPYLADLKNIPGLGILATLLLVFVIGLISKNYFGGKLINLGHKLMQTIPLVNNVYGGIMQLVKAFSSTDGSAPFKTVVMLEFPRRGIWTMGFVSSEDFLMAEKIAKQKLLNVFIPAAPIPSQGLFIMVPRQDVHVLPMTTEEAFKMIATLGVVQATTPAGVAALVVTTPLPASSAKSGRRQATRPAKTRVK